MAVRAKAVNNHGPVYFRTYIPKHGENPLPDIKIWEAARATSAAPAYFKRIKVGSEELIDGGLGANNPVGWYGISLPKLQR